MHKMSGWHWQQCQPTATETAAAVSSNSSNFKRRRWRQEQRRQLQQHSMRCPSPPTLALVAGDGLFGSTAAAQCQRLLIISAVEHFKASGGPVDVL